MGVNISGKGVLSGLASFVTAVINNPLIKSLVFRYTLSGSNTATGFYYGSSTKTVEETVYTTEYVSNPGLVAISSWPSYNKNVYTTTNYEDWQTSTLDGFPYGAIYGTMITPNQKIMAYDGYGNRAISRNGLTWTYYSQPLVTGKMTVTGATIMLSAQENDFIKYSTDNGVTWNNSNGYAIDGRISLVHGKFINHAYGARFQYSDDGITWSQVRNLDDEFSQQDPSVTIYLNSPEDSEMLYLGDTWILKSTAQILYSTDLVNWSLSPIWYNAGRIGKICYLNSVQKFVIFATNDSWYALSPDLNTKTLYDSFSGTYGENNEFGFTDTTAYNVKTQIGDRLAVFGFGGLHDALTSTDGVTWQRHPGVIGISCGEYIQENQYFTAVDTDNSFGNTSFISHPIYEISWDGSNFYTSKMGHIPNNNSNIIFSQYGYATGIKRAPFITMANLVASTVYTTVEVPGSWIGGQGSSGSYLEQLLPVSLYDVESPTTFERISVRNDGQSTQYIDLGVQNFPNDNNIAWSVLDYPIPAGQTVNFPYQYTLNQKSIMINATEANTLTFGLYSA